MRHAIRIAIIWIVVTAILEVLIGIVPIPSPVGSDEGEGIHQTIYMLFYLGAPIFAFVWVVLLYGLITYRARDPQTETERPPMPGSNALILLWAGITFLIVLFMAGWGTFTLHEITQPPSVAAEGSAASTRSHPGATNQKQPGGLPAGSVYTNARPLIVQAIGQQWFWTFRYPSFGGMETKELVVPVGVPVLFHITSLDVVHSFWIYEEDVKEDAVPGQDNTAWMVARFPIHTEVNGKNSAYCNELCGLWHGYMVANVTVEKYSAFKSWATHMESYEKSTGLLKNLPSYAPVYYPASNANFPPAPQDQSP
ncbi:MAG TPA: cytochrome c oxidase subunit II [Chloroflexota bacterium]|nr:cytochrome c oxidase subunit II [Chloroflexota bacterium]